LEYSPLMRSRFPPASLSGRTRVTAAMSAIRRTLGGDGWISLGDAAATYDPLAGTGVVLALKKGLSLARLLLGEASTAAFARFAQMERAAFDDYLTLRRSMYRGESRWTTAPFWLRRTVASP
jgi:2-polyprenyl-6-methoxyphenol hydroxylase-like FAD-dependent oxidoreductase